MTTTRGIGIYAGLAFVVLLGTTTWVGAQVLGSVDYPLLPQDFALPPEGIVVLAVDIGGTGSAGPGFGEIDFEADEPVFPGLLGGLSGKGYHSTRTDDFFEPVTILAGALPDLATLNLADSFVMEGVPLPLVAGRSYRFEVYFAEQNPKRNADVAVQVGPASASVHVVQTAMVTRARFDFDVFEDTTLS